MISGSFPCDAFFEKLAKLDMRQVRRHLRGFRRGLRRGRWRGRAREPTPTPGVASHPGSSRDAGLLSVRRAPSDVHRVGLVVLACKRSRHVIHPATTKRERRGEKNDERRSHDRRRPKVVKIDRHARQVDPGKSLITRKGQREEDVRNRRDISEQCLETEETRESSLRYNHARIKGRGCRVSKKGDNYGRD